MKLHREERDYYVVSITVEPALTGTWEASFDNGETWVTGTPTDGNWAWLVAGPDFDASDVGMDDSETVAVVRCSVDPLIRIKETPIVDIEKGPTIEVWS